MSAAPLPEYVTEALRMFSVRCEERGMLHDAGLHEQVQEWRAIRERSAATATLIAAIRRYAEEAARGAGEPGTVTDNSADAAVTPLRPAGCVCPVERVRREVRACPVHGEPKP